MFCGNCGTKLEEGSAFCNGCGAKLPQSVLCVNCGRRLEPGSVFCGVCGASQLSKEPEPVPTPPAPGKKGKGKKWLIPLVGAVVLLVVAAACLIPVLFPGKETVYLLTGLSRYSDAEQNLQLDVSYDEQGRPVKYCLETNSGTRVYSLRYDSQGNCKALTIRNQQGDVIDSWGYNFRYDEDGLPTRCQLSREYRGSPMVVSTCRFSHDERGNLILATYDGNGSARWDHYVYDSQDRLIQETFCRYMGSFSEKRYSISRFTYKYDKEGRLYRIRYSTAWAGEEPEYDEADDLDTWEDGRYNYALSYDKEGRLSSFDYRDSEYAGDREYEYDRDGNYDFSPSDYAYDEAGNLTFRETESGHRLEYAYREMALSKEDATLAKRLQRRVPEDLRSTVFLRSLDPVYEAMYPIGPYQQSNFYYYLIPNPLWGCP